MGGAAFAASAFVQSLVPSLVLLSIAMLGLASMFGPFWTLASSSVTGRGAAAGIALINAAGLVAVVAILALGGLLILTVRRT